MVSYELSVSTNGSPAISVMKLYAGGLGIRVFSAAGAGIEVFYRTVIPLSHYL